MTSSPKSTRVGVQRNSMPNTPLMGSEQPGIWEQVARKRVSSGTATSATPRASSHEEGVGRERISARLVTAEATADGAHLFPRLPG
jgi:hypothetical protein